MASNNKVGQSRANKPHRVESEDLVDPTKKRTQGGRDSQGALGGRGKRPAEERMHQELVKLIAAACKNLVENKDQVTVADLVKLVQVEKDMRPQGCERMVVEWVDSMPEGE